MSALRSVNVIFGGTDFLLLSGDNLNFKNLIPGLALAIAFGIAGCSSPHSPMSTKQYRETPTQTSSAKTYPAHKRKVWITVADLPANVKYDVIEQIDVGAHWYGSVAKLNPLFAKVARKAGADAVIRVKTWYQPTSPVIISPEGVGQAVKIIEPKDFDLTTLPGGWY
ncbi:MAG: hypothetical protein ACOH12_10965 [Parvibaculaceae bacterium]